VRDGSI